MSRDDADLDRRLLRAVAASHRQWFGAREEGRVLVDGPVAVEAVAGASGVWSLGRDDELGVRLVERGFDWGWRPHWMGVELGEEPPDAGDYEIVTAGPPYAKTLPYREKGPLPDGAAHLGVRLREKLIGQVIVLPGDDGVAGIYSMGVAPKVQGRGIGLALTDAALRAARELGCDAAVLNATPDGERLYARAGFRSLGWGQTWWRSPGAPASTARQVAITEATGFGDIAGLEALSPSESELSTPLPGGVIPLGLAALVGQAGSLDHLLTRFPALATLRFPPHGGNLLHVAVEHDRPEVVETALRHRVDPEAHDASFDATPLGWADHFGTAAGRSLLRAVRQEERPGEGS